MRILALDLGTKTGWAYSEGGSGVWDLSPRRHESQGMRWIKLQQSLREFIHLRVDMIVYEEVARHMGTHAAHIYGGFVAAIQTFCEKWHIEYQGIPVGTIKKFATGKGNASKEMMIAAAQRLCGEREFTVRGENKTAIRGIIDDNEADAICLLVYVKTQNAIKTL